MWTLKETGQSQLVNPRPLLGLRLKSWRGVKVPSTELTLRLLVLPHQINTPGSWKDRAPGWTSRNLPLSVFRNETSRSVAVPVLKFIIYYLCLQDGSSYMTWVTSQPHKVISLVMTHHYQSHLSPSARNANAHFFKVWTIWWCSHVRPEYIP